jgi:glycosyltransferase 2 family protein
VRKEHRKAVLLVLKILVAVGLLAWVVSMVHWRDYVVAKGQDGKSGKEYAVLEALPNANAPQWLRVSRGILSWKEEANRPAGDFDFLRKEDGTPVGGLIRPGLRASLERAYLPLLAIVLAGYLISLSIIGVRWWFLLKLQEIHISLRQAMKLTYLGQFYNTVVPGTVGGDLLKAYYIATHTPKKAGALLSIFVDRVLGFAELAILAAVMLAVVWAGGLAPLSQLRRASFFVVLFLVAITGALVFLLVPGIRRLFRLQKLYQRLPIAHHIAAAGDAADLYRRRLGGLLKAILMTVGAQVIWICSIGIMGKALKLDVPFYSYLVFVPVIYMCAAFLPSPGGVGVVEGAFVFFLGSPTCTASEILALALLARLMDIGRGLPGLWVAITGPRLPKAGAMEAELSGADLSAAPTSETLPSSEPPRK